MLVRKYRTEDGRMVREINGSVVSAMPVSGKERVGTALSKIIEGLLRIKGTSSCNCVSLASEMDRWGVVGCEANREFIVNSLVSHRDMLSDALRSQVLPVPLLDGSLIAARTAF